MCSIMNGIPKQDYSDEIFYDFQPLIEFVKPSHVFHSFITERENCSRLLGANFAKNSCFPIALRIC